MDSQNPKHYEQSAATHAYQDVPHAGDSPALPIRHTAAPPEATIRYEAPRFSASATPGASSSSSATVDTSGATLEETASRPLRPLLRPSAAVPRDEQPVTVPVLSAQPITKRWERVLDDDRDTTDYERARDYQSIWPEDEQHYEQNAEAGDLYNYDELDLDLARGVAGRRPLREDAFALHERSWEGWRRSRKPLVMLFSLAVMLAVGTAGALVVVSYMQQATQHITIAAPVPTTGKFSGGLVIQPAEETAAPTPVAPKYQMGVWMSNNAPSGGTVKVFVRVSKDIGPIAHVPVKLVVQTPGGTLHYGPSKTDAYGLATFTVRFGGVRGSPCFVTASATIENNKELTADTVFVPI
ncbi:MAG: hypothetical protein ACM3N4_02945 [Nitrososphaerota archaeon]